jgi:molybdate transport system ATP-binding protein
MVGVVSGIAVELHNVSLDLGDRPILDSVSLRIPPGTHGLLLGANGAGKTQLLKMCAGERWPRPDENAWRIYRDAKGRVLHLSDLLPRLTLVSGERQDKYYRYDWNFSVARVVASGVQGVERPLVALTVIEQARVRRVLDRLGLWRLRRRRFLTLSYGERRRVLLARALVSRPRLLLLDEAYNGLDRDSRAWFNRELTRLARTKLTILLTVHRLEDAPPMFRHVWVLQAGRLVYDGPRAKAPQQWLATQTVGADAPAKLPTRLATKVINKTLIRLTRVSLYRDYRLVIRQIDWHLQRGQHWAIVGANGSGKSTLLGCLYGAIPIAAGGRIERADHPPGTHIEAWRSRVGLVSPELQTEYLEEISVGGLVVSGLHASVGLEQKPSPAEWLLARAALKSVGLRINMHRSIRTLSYGQRRLALFARALILTPQALLLDEPLTGLDSLFRAHIRALLSSLAQSGVQLVMAVHHTDDLVPEINRVLMLEQGIGRVSQRVSSVESP